MLDAMPCNIICELGNEMHSWFQSHNVHTEAIDNNNKKISQRKGERMSLNNMCFGSNPKCDKTDSLYSNFFFPDPLKKSSHIKCPWI